METTQKNTGKESEELLRKCCELRQQLYHKLQQSLEDGSARHHEEMKKLHAQINEIMDKL